MSKLLVSILIGLAAGVVDVVPMILQKLDKHANWSAFVHWIILGVFISYIDLPLAGWLKGLVVAELAALPIVILVAKDNKKGVVPILVMSAVLGVLVGLATAKAVV